VSGDWVWLDGRFVLAAEARVPALSRTVRLGVGVYETIRVARGQALLLDRHLARLEAGARPLGLWPGPIEWRELVAGLARRNQLPDASARITLGDGFALLHLTPLPPDLAGQRAEGIALATATWNRPFADLKTTSRFELEQIEARAGGETLLVGSDGGVLETTRANFFAVGVAGLETAPLPDVLPGIARQVVLELAAESGLAVREVAPRIGDRALWREAFVTNAPRGVRPVVAIDAAPLASKRPGPIALRLQRALDLRSGLTS
jgi:branched-chain amino acid aminotransferase